MRRNNSEFIKQQPFIQSLRTSVNIPKDPAFLEYRRGTVETLPDEFVFSQKEKSLSKSKVCRIIRKQSIGNLKLQQKNHVKALICENVLEIDFNKICKKNTPNQDIKKDTFNGSNTICLDLKTIEILILFVDKLSGKKNFNFFNNFEKDGTKKQNPTKMLISCFQLSIQDPSKVKRTFEINLLQKMEDKQFLRINIIEDFSVDSLYVNGKQIFIEKRQALSFPVQQMIYTFNPWDLINQRKILLQSKIMSERPKSKIKWSSSLNQNSDQNFSQTETKVSKISQIEQNYGLRSCKEPVLKFSTELKRRSDVSSNQQKQQRNFVNVFSCIQKQQETNSMGSTLQSEKDSTLKQKSIFSRETTRKNNMISSTNNQKRSSRLYQIEENVQTNRPKSSFKNLKEKNDYFQMKESQRKKSLKKNMQIKTDEPVIRNAQINRKSSEIKLQYGIV